MLLTGRLAARTAGLAVLALGATLSAAGPAAAANDWGTELSFDRAKVQACVVSVDDGEAWKVKLRAGNRNNFRVKGNAQAYDGETPTDARWGSGWVRKGDTSKVGAVKVGLEDTWQVLLTMRSSQAGNGGFVTVADLNAC